MARRKSTKKKSKLQRQRRKPEAKSRLLYTIRQLSHKQNYMNKHIDKLWELVVSSDHRLQDIEIQTNLMTRLITTLAIERLGMKLSTFRRMVRQIEREAIADSEVSELEDLFRLEQKGLGERTKGAQGRPR